MRDIRFRQWTGNQFVYWGFLEDESVGGKVTFHGPSSGDTGAGIFNARTTDHQQFTGLQDRNGVDIYEGDIVVYEWERDRKHVISWDDESARWCKGWDNCWSSFSTHSPANIVEVIGNIHEHGHLLYGR